MKTCIFALLLATSSHWDCQSNYRFFSRKIMSVKTAPDPYEELKRRQQTTSYISTCGYKDGRADEPRTANTGYDCRVDTLNALWGFCPTTVIAATDCGLAGACIDLNTCTAGCGIIGTPGITTFTCTGSGQAFCSTAFLTVGPDQTYSYIACGNGPSNENYFAEPTTTIASTTTSTSPSIQLNPSSTTSSRPSPMSSLPSSTSNTGAQATTSMSPSSPAASSQAITSASTSNTSSNNTGAIVGGVIGGIALICFVALALLFLRRYRSTRTPKSDVVPPRVFPQNSELMGQNAFPQEKYGIEMSLFPKWKKYAPFEMSTEPMNSPVELPI